MLLCLWDFPGKSIWVGCHCFLWDLTEAEVIKKRWQEYTEELYKKDLYDAENHNDVITHLGTAILECKVKWALGSSIMNKVGRCVRIPIELFQILKMMLWKCCTQYLHSANLENSSVAMGLEKVFSFQSQRRAVPKNVQTTAKLNSSQKLEKECSSNSPSQASTIRESELPDVQGRFREGRGTRDQIANICCIIKKAREFQEKKQKTNNNNKKNTHLLLLCWLLQSLWLCRSQ